MLARHQGRSNLRHLPNNKKPGTNLIMVDSDIPMEKFSSPVEHKLFIWSFMEPPRISKPTPIVSAERYGKYLHMECSQGYSYCSYLERVRKMLDKPYEDDARETHIKSNCEFKSSFQIISFNMPRFYSNIEYLAGWNCY